MDYRVKKAAVLLLEQLTKLLWIIPVRKNSVLFYSYDGKELNDNPLYLSRALRRKNPELRQTFVCGDDSSLGLVDKPSNIVKPGSLAFFVGLLTSKAIVYNSSLPSYLPIRKSQVVLNTWHGGSPLKTCGLSDNQVTDYSYFHLDHQAKKVTAYLTSSRFMTEEVIRGSLAFKGEVVETGMPRNSVLFGDTSEIRARVRDSLALQGESFVVLYAPTFRGDANNGGFINENLQLSPEEIANAFSGMAAGRKVEVLFRAHHAMRGVTGMGEGFIDVTHYPDMQELLIASDVLITDYSSCMGDMCLRGAPVFLYAPDLEEYTRDRGFYWDIHDLPFPLSETKAEFYDVVAHFSISDYHKKVKEYLVKLGSIEGPESADRAAGWLLSRIADNTGRN